MYRIKSSLGVGTVRTNKRTGSCLYSVNSKEDLINVIIPHFSNYPLLTQKRADFELLKLVLELMNKKEAPPASKNGRFPSGGKLWVLKHPWITV